GMGAPVGRASARPDLYTRGQAYGIPGSQVDGMDVVSVRAAADKAVAAVRSGKGPYILEMLTYRYRGHSMSDPAKYRTKEEVAKMRQEHDPIDHLRQRILSEGHADEAQLKNIDREIRDVISTATDFAQTSPEPDPGELYTDVLAEA